MSTSYIGRRLKLSTNMIQQRETMVGENSCDSIRKLLYEPYGKSRYLKLRPR